MGRAGWLLVLAAGCADQPPFMHHDEPWPPLVIDVEVTGGVRVMAYERDRPDVCNQHLFVRPGACDDPGDAWVCSDYVADWINRVELKSGALDIATTGWHEFGQAWFGGDEIEGLHALTVTLIATDGQEAVIAIPERDRPRPTVETLTYDGERLRLDWTAEPAATTARAEVYNGLVGRRCHVFAGERAELAWPAAQNSSLFPTSYAVSAYAPATATRTALGEARVWLGATVRGTLPDD